MMLPKPLNPNLLLKLKNAFAVSFKYKEDISCQSSLFVNLRHYLHYHI